MKLLAIALGAVLLLLALNMVQLSCQIDFTLPGGQHFTSGFGAGAQIYTPIRTLPEIRQ